MGRAAADALAAALGGVAGAPPEPGVLHVVAVPRTEPSVTSVRAALCVAGADQLRVPPELPPDVLAPLTDGERVAGTLASVDAADLSPDHVVVQLVATAVQGAPAVVEQLHRLHAAGVPVEVVPSTSEVDAVLAAAGVGTGVSRRPDDGRLDVAVVAADRPDVKAWRAALARRGYLDHTPVVLVERAGTPRQTATRMQLKELTDAERQGPLTLVVGDDAVGPVGWRERLPLRGVTVANLRAAHQAPALTARLRSLGAAVLEAPLLGIDEGDVAGLDAAVARLDEGAVEALCLTSPNGVRAVAASLARLELDARVLSSVGRVACVGPGTAATLWDELRVRADLVPELHTTSGLAEAMGAPPSDGAGALLPRADLATDELRLTMEAAGWTTVEVDAYRTVPLTPPDVVLDAFASGAVQLLPVLSSSMARQLVTVGRERGVAGAVVSIGPVTSGTLRKHGIAPLVEADPHDLDGLVAALVRAADRAGLVA